jgi:hypothetical protein
MQRDLRPATNLRQWHGYSEPTGVTDAVTQVSGSWPKNISSGSHQTSIPPVAPIKDSRITYCKTKIFIDHRDVLNPTNTANVHRLHDYTRRNHMGQPQYTSKYNGKSWQSTVESECLGVDRLRELTIYTS